MNLAQNSVQYNEDGGPASWLLEFEAYPPVNENQVRWIVTDKRRDLETTLSLGDSTQDQIFSSNPDIKKEKTEGFSKSMKHKIVLQIKPETDGEGQNFDVKFVIKVTRLFFFYFF